jgi:putative DNA primase/helicase
MTEQGNNRPENATNGENSRGRYREQVEQRQREAEEQLQAEEKDQKSQTTSQFWIDCLDSNERGDGCAVAVLGKNRFCQNMNSIEWLEWSGHYWKPDTAGGVYYLCEEAALQYLEERGKISRQIGQAAQDQENEHRKMLEARRSQIEKRVNRLRSWRGQTNALNFASIVPGGLGVPGDVFDSNGWILPCKNGVVDLKTGSFRNGRQDDYATMVSPVEWEGINTPAETLQRTILEIFGGNQELADFVQRLLGYALLGEHREAILPVLYGQGRNGKSLLIEVMRWVFGPLAGPIPAEMTIDQGKSRNSSGPSPDIMLLKGLRMAIATETDQGQRISPSQIKWLTGGDTLVGRSPHDKHLTSFEPTHTLFLLTNHKPHAPAEDFAFWERVLLIPFEMSFVDREPQADNERRQDKDLKRKLLNEASGILAWLVRGCLEDQVQGLNPPDIVKKATSEYRREEDVLADFIDEECIVLESANDGSTPSTKLYERFGEWWKRTRGNKVPSQTWFGRNLSRKFERKKWNGVFHYFGVRLI